MGCSRHAAAKWVVLRAGVQINREMCLLFFEPFGLDAASGGRAMLKHGPKREFRAGQLRDYGLGP